MTRIWWALGIVLTCAALVVCLIPMPHVPRSFELNDKLAHILGHTALAVYFTGLVARQKWWKIFAFLLVFGIFIEFAQHYMAMGRQGDPRDVIGNAAGAALGLLLGLLGLSKWPIWLETLFGRRAAP
jgi:VanZ family protein